MRFEKRWKCTECGTLHVSWLKAVRCHKVGLERVRVVVNDDGTLKVRGEVNTDEDETFGLMNDLLGYGP